MIPLKIETLLAGRVVEQNRVEYKEGWNPCDIIHSICAFANDYHNMNGGYLVIGVKARWCSRTPTKRITFGNIGFCTTRNIPVL